LSCACIPTLVQIGCGLPDLFRKESKKVNTIIGFRPIISYPSTMPIPMYHKYCKFQTNTLHSF